jgi:exosortase/archaeosortase family protein
MTLLFLLVELDYFKNYLDINGIFSQNITILSANILELFMSVSYSQHYIYLSGGNRLEILFGCNGLEAILLYVSAILAYPATYKAKLYGLIIGFIVINLINIVRIVLLGYVLEYHHDMFGVMHDYITQNIMIVFVFLLFIVYLNLIGSKDASTQ